MCARDFDPPRAYARQLLKDMKNVKAFAGDVGVDLPLVERAVARFAEFVAQGNEMKDPASIALFYDHAVAGEKITGEKPDQGAGKRPGKRQ